MAVKFFQGPTGAVSARAISGHPTGVTIPAAQRVQGRTFDQSTRQGRILASQQPNTDRRRFVTHS